MVLFQIKKISYMVLLVVWFACLWSLHASPINTHANILDVVQLDSGITLALNKDGTVDEIVMNRFGDARTHRRGIEMLTGVTKLLAGPKGKFYAIDFDQARTRYVFCHVDGVNLVHCDDLGPDIIDSAVFDQTLYLVRQNELLSRSLITGDTKLLINDPVLSSTVEMIVVGRNLVLVTQGGQIYRINIAEGRTPALAPISRTRAEQKQLLFVEPRTLLFADMASRDNEPWVKSFGSKAVPHNLDSSNGSYNNIKLFRTHDGRYIRYDPALANKVWQMGDFRDVVQTTDGTTFALTTNNTVTEIAMNAEGAVRLVRENVAGLTDISSLIADTALYSQSFFAVDTDDEHSYYVVNVFNNHGQVTTFDLGAGIVACAAVNGELHYVNTEGKLFSRNLKTQQTKAVAEFEDLRNPQFLVSVGKSLVVVMQTGWIHRVLLSNPETPSLHRLGRTFIKDRQFLPIDLWRFGLFDVAKFEREIYLKDLKRASMLKDLASTDDALENYKMFRTQSGRYIAYNTSLVSLPKPRLFQRSKQIISFGWKCLTRHHIQAGYLGVDSMETNIFDWVLTRKIDTVTRLLNTQVKDSWKIFDYKKIDVDRSRVYDAHLGGRYKVAPQELADFRAPHDVPKDIIDNPSVSNEAVFREFTDKYQRRHARLVHQLQNRDQIYALRFGGDQILTKKQVQKFFAALERIKPNNEHVLVYVSTVGTAGDYAEFESEYRFKFFNINDYPQKFKYPTANWREDNYSWEYVFDWIDKQQ